MAIKEFTDLKIRYNKKNFSAKEKTAITKYFKILNNHGLIQLNEENRYEPAVKFIPDKKKKEKIKGAPKLTGYFVRGAKPSDQITKDGIIKGKFFDKILIPMDFTGADQYEEDELFDFVYAETALSIQPYFQELQNNDYFTITTANGWEIGRGKTEDKKQKAGQPIGKNTGKRNKIERLAERITELLIRASNKYQIGFALISGVYLYKFKKQRKPTKAELKKINGKRRK